MIEIRPSFKLAFALALIPARVNAQFEQYTAPGSFEEERESTEELLERSAKDARWLLGRIAVHPWISVRDLAHVDNADSGEGGRTESDLTASIGLGVRAYMPIGHEVTLALHALPEYVWWQDSRERRRVNGRYGVGLFGNLGRTGVELSVTRQEDARFVSREIERRINTRDQAVTVSLESDFGRGVTVFGEGSFRRLRFMPEQEDASTGLDNLERDEKLLRAGLTFHLPRGFAVGLGVEHSEVDFENSEDRSNSGVSPILHVDYDGNPLFLALRLALRNIEPEPGSRFVPYEELTGSVRLAWRTTPRTEVQLFGDRNLVYSTTNRWAYFEDTGVGVGVRTSLTSQMSIRFFVEEGVNEYTSFGPAADPRRDDFEAFGGDLRFRLGRFHLSLSASETRYESNLSQFDRSVTVLRSGLSLGLGSSSPWG